MGLREQKKQQTRQRLLSVASTLFDQQGFQVTTVDDIAAQAKVSRMTFFNYFDAKEKLLEGLAIDVFSQHSSLFEVMVGDEGTLGAAAPPELGERLDVIIKHRKLLKMVIQHTQLLHNLNLSTAQSSDAIAPYIENHFQNRINRVCEAQQQGVIRDDIEATEICHLYDALRNNVVGRWLVDDDAAPDLLKQRFSAAIRVFQAGLKTTKSKSA